MTAREQFELVWPTLQMGEAIYCEWPQVLHVRVMFGEWDDRFLMLEMTALDTWGFAETAAQPPVRLAVGPAAVHRRRATEPGLEPALAC